jgi:hypothetical protein
MIPADTDEEKNITSLFIKCFFRNMHTYASESLAD